MSIVKQGKERMYWNTKSKDEPGSQSTARLKFLISNKFKPIRLQLRLNSHGVVLMF